MKIEIQVNGNQTTWAVEPANANIAKVLDAITGCQIAFFAESDAEGDGEKFSVTVKSEANSLSWEVSEGPDSGQLYAALCDVHNAISEAVEAAWQADGLFVADEHGMDELPFSTAPMEPLHA